MRIGLFGLPFSGKTTVFQALAGLKAENDKPKKNDANRAVVKVPDSRLDKLEQIYQAKKKVYATVEYIEINENPGQRKEQGISDGMLGHMRSIDALAHVVRIFNAEEIQHVRGSVDGLRDIEDIDADLLFSDLAVIEKNLEKLERNLKAGKKTELLRKKEVLLKCKEHLEKELSLRSLFLIPEELEIIHNYQFLTLKPYMIILNSGEGQDISDIRQKVTERYKDTPETLVIDICGSLEMEIAQLDSEDQQEFLEELGVEQPALNRFIKESFRLLGLMVFFTAGEKEVHAWTVRKNSNAVKAAGAIHTDLERGFIRAEVFHYDQLLEAGGSEAQLKKNGQFRLEGKDYQVQDGDILCIRFNVKK